MESGEIITMDIRKKYQMEIDFILRDLDELIRGEFSEKTGVKISGSACNKARNIKDGFIELLNKIESSKESVGEIIQKTHK